MRVVEARSARSFRRHSHDEFGIGVILDGAQRSASGRGPVDAGPGDVITVNPGEVHDGSPIGRGGRFWRMLYLDPALIAALSDQLTEGGEKDFEFFAPVVQGSPLVPLLHRLFTELSDGAGDASGSVEERLLSILAGAAGVHVDHPAGLHSRIMPAREMIDDAPASAVTLQDLARTCGLSTFQLLRGFAALTGLTPHAYLMQKRVDLARRLIGQAVPLAEAALAAGFADQSHMTRAFASRFGYSPGAYAAACR